ncbi:MAG: hypothetical protein UZ21_OP11001001121 [Microgenomates bacterium OLB22]|nr:MAG: hypothetical protein UZ21_OP11001001121 [Microgenomates bacterium OLB22]
MTELVSHTTTGPPEREVPESSAGSPHDDLFIDTSLNTTSDILLSYTDHDNNLLHYVDEGIKTLLLTYYAQEICRDRSHPVGQYIGHMLDLLTGRFENENENERQRLQIAAIQDILVMLAQEDIPPEMLQIDYLLELGRRVDEDDFDCGD